MAGAWQGDRNRGQFERESMNTLKTGIFVSIGFAVFLIAALYGLQQDPVPSGAVEELFVYCAAGIQPPVEQAARQYQDEYGIAVRLQYGGSGQLLSNLKIARTGDLYIAGDDSYIRLARRQQLVDESIPLAVLTPVIAARNGNPKRIQSVHDLIRDDVRIALANPESAAIGKSVQQVLQQINLWEQVKNHVTVFKPTVNEIANDIKLGSIDAGIVWDAMIAQYPELEAVESSVFEQAQSRIEVGVLRSTVHPTAALKFARYLASRDKGLPYFQAHGYTPVQGDRWEEVPRVVLYSGGVNRLAIDETIKQFEQREGVRIETVYNGCGILVGMMKQGQRPDAYFACDVSFTGQVADLLIDPLNISQTDMVIVVQKGNPKQIHQLSDLTQPGLRVGVANAEQSALGALTQRLLEQAGLDRDVLPNVVSQTPTADLLVNQIRAGSLDAVIVYEANTPYVKDELEVIRVDHPAANAIQPYAVLKQSDHCHLMNRLLQAICSDSSKEKFQATGFRWLVDEGQNH